MVISVPVEDDVDCTLHQRSSVVTVGTGSLASSSSGRLTGAVVGETYALEEDEECAWHEGHIRWAHSAPVHRAATNIRWLLLSALPSVLLVKREYRAKYRLSYPRGRRPGAAARQSPAGTRVSSPPSALRIARAVVQALTDRARCARSRWPPCVAAVSADPGRSLTPPRAAAVPGDPPRGAVAGAAKGGIGDRGCAAAFTVTPTCTSGIARGERWSVLRACGVSNTTSPHRLRRILEVPEYQHIGQST